MSLNEVPDAQLEGTYWKLVELKDDPVRVLPDHREAHFVLAREKHQVRGSGGCNRLLGTYEMEDDRLSFGPLVTTRKMCPEIMEQEQTYLQALQSVTHFLIEGDGLQLFTSGEMVARFEAVYL